MQTKRFDNAAVQVDQLVTAPDRAIDLSFSRDACIAIPFFQGLQIGATLCQKLHPNLVSDSSNVAKNTSETVGLTALLSVWKTATVLAFGSRIHGNEHLRSDLDLMIINDDIPGREYTYGKISIQFETNDVMIQRALDGDLFIKYLSDGAIAAYDPNDQLTKLKQAFVPRPSYERTLKGCADVAFLLMRPEIACIDPSFAARKIVWALRTTSMAEGHDPFIHPESVLPEDRAVIEAAKQSKSAGNMAQSYPDVQAFFARRGFADPLPDSCKLDAFKQYFASVQNPVGARMCDDLFALSKRPESNRRRQK